MTIPAPWSLPLWMRRRIMRSLTVDAVVLAFQQMPHVMHVGSMTVTVRMPADE